MSSRWANNDDEDAEHIARRKMQKEAKRRSKEQKQSKAETEKTALSSSINGPNTDEADRSSKRLRTTSPLRQDMAQDTNLLDYKAGGFGGSNTVDQYDILNNIEEGSYGFVSRARIKSSGEIVALKRLKIDRNVEGFPVTGLREIRTLQACVHQHIVNLREVVLGGDSLHK